MKKQHGIIGALLVMGWLGTGAAWAGGTGGAAVGNTGTTGAAGTTGTAVTGCTSSCPSTCAAQNYFGNLAQESLALAQPPNPQTSFAQGCLSGLSGFNLNTDFSFSGLDSIFQNLMNQIMNQACSMLTSTMNNEVSQGNSILNFALSPAQLEQNALNSVSGTVLNAEQGALNTATSPVTNTTGTYASDAGTVQNTVSNATGNALSGNWVNNLY